MIGGNTKAIIQTKTTSKNTFGEKVTSWSDFTTITGFLDFSGGDGSYKTKYKGDLEETTHVFICDYSPIDVEPTRCRMLIAGKTYDVLMIDDPMGLHKHLEIMLKYNGVIE